MVSFFYFATICFLRFILTNDFTGEYQDRRSQDKIDCSRTIWILATNAHDPIIQDFSATNNHVLFADADEAEKDRLMKQLSKQIKDNFLARHGVSTDLICLQLSCLLHQEHSD
jgi:hypothetical protein